MASPLHLVNKKEFELEFVFPYLDDILVASETEEHKTHLKVVFDRLQKHGLRVNISKSILGVTHLEFLGYLITPEGSKPLPEKVDAILSYKLSETIRDLRTFLGLINFYRRYLKDAAKNRAILREYLKGSKKNYKTRILWTEEAKENFERCKQDIPNATLLSFPDLDLQMVLFTDASNFAIGSVLQQFKAGREDNLVADAFSRIEAVTVIDYDAIADKQTQDAELQQLMRSNSSVKFI
ncbi:retrovirus-related Pol polyprotein from transposon opus [Trichonephila clavipes]|nr:retrovirus-related Pol polyprotein from transposon opus [Trichonephila clavipes]